MTTIACALGPAGVGTCVPGWRRWWLLWFGRGLADDPADATRFDPSPADARAHARAGGTDPLDPHVIEALERDPDGPLLRQVLEEFPRDVRAFRELVSVHWNSIWAICASVLLNEHDAEEAAQDVFLKAHRYLPSFRFESRFSTWLRRIARNTALNMLAARRRQYTARDHIGEDPLLTRMWRPWKAPVPGSDAAQLRKLIARLDPADRMVLVLHEMEGLSYEDIAEDLGVSVGAARMRAMRARERLRALLAPPAPGGAGP